MKHDFVLVLFLSQGCKAFPLSDGSLVLPGLELSCSIIQIGFARSLPNSHLDSSVFCLLLNSTVTRPQNQQTRMPKAT